MELTSAYLVSDEIANTLGFWLRAHNFKQFWDVLNRLSVRADLPGSCLPLAMLSLLDHLGIEMGLSVRQNSWGHGGLTCQTLRDEGLDVLLSLTPDDATRARVALREIRGNEYGIARHVAAAYNRGQTSADVEEALALYRRAIDVISKHGSGRFIVLAPC